MAISLKKGGNVSLTQEVPSLRKILVGLGWDQRITSGDDFDLDATAFLLNDKQKVDNEKDFIFYGNKTSRCGSVEVGEDDKTGGLSDGDDETIMIDLEKVPERVKKISVCASIYEYDIRKQNFGQVSNAYMRLVNMDTDREIAKFDLTEDYSTETAMIFGEIYRHNNEWKFKAVGQGYDGGLEAMCNIYGVQVSD